MALKRENFIKVSRGKILSRVFKLREELQLFFKDNNKESFSNFLEVTKWLLKLDYLANIYQHLNALNTSMRGLKENILTSTDKILVFKNKIQICKKHLRSGNTEMFPLLHKIRDQSD
jgi:F0F1-type ATP synthase delta subunit